MRKLLTFKLLTSTLDLKLYTLQCGWSAWRVVKFKPLWSSYLRFFEPRAKTKPFCASNSQCSQCGGLIKLPADAARARLDSMEAGQGEEGWAGKAGQIEAILLDLESLEVLLSVGVLVFWSVETWPCQTI